MTTTNMPASWTSRTIYLEANPWRVLRRLLAAEPKTLSFATLRPWQRRDKDLAMMARLVDLGLIDAVGTQDGEPTYRLTSKGKEAAELGEVRIEQAGASGSKKAKKK